MKKINKMIGFLLIGLLLSKPGLGQIKMKLELREDKKTYLVSIVPERDYDFPKEIVGSIQLTIKVPKGSDFMIGGIVSQIDDTQWLRNNTLEESQIAPKFNYYSFGVDPLGAKVRLHKGEELNLFTFQNIGNLKVVAELMNNEDEILPVASKELSIDMYNNISIHKRNAISNDYIGNVKDKQINSKEGKVSIISIESVFPNPSKDKLKIVWNNYLEDSENLSISIMDITGKERINQRAEASYGVNEHEVNVSILPEGNYLIHIKNGIKGVSQSHRVSIVR